MHDQSKGTSGADEAADVLDKISKFSDKYRATAERLHEVVMKANPELQPRLWYGMPGYAKTKDGPVVCFLREDKYITFGLTENANFQHENNALAACAWLLTELNEALEEQIASIVRSSTK